MVLFMKKNNVNFLEPSQEQLDILLKYYQTGRYTDAEKLSLSITQEFPKHQFAWKVLAAVLKLQGRINESIIASQKSIQLDPQDAEAHNNLGVLLQHQGKLKEAEVSCSKAIKLNPGYTQAHFNLGNILKVLGRLKDAEASYIKAIELKPDYTQAHFNFGNMLKVLGRIKEAEASYRKTIEFKHDFAQAHNNLGVLLQQQGKFKEAESSFSKAVFLKPNYSQAHNNLGVLQQQQGKFKEAESSYRKAIELKPNYTEAHFKLGKLLKELGRLKEAEANYNQAIVLKHDFIDALEHRWKLLFEQKRYEAALKDADLLVSKRSRAFDLTTLYAMGRIEEIYKRIETHSKLDGENLRIAAFAAFVAELEKKPTSYNFCPNPMDFIHVSNISSHNKNSTVFVKEVIGELNNIKTNWEPNDRTARKGFVTDQKFNLFSSSSDKLEQLKSIIFDEINKYYLKFKEETCSYIKKWPSEISLYGWHVVLKQQGYNTAHIHPSGWLSGVIYLKVVPALGKNEGAIEFSLNGEDYSHKDSPSVIFQPKEGDIVFFPSSLYHRTIPFSTDTDRIIISFDLMPKAAKH